DRSTRCARLARMAERVILVMGLAVCAAACGAPDSGRQAAQPPAIKLYVFDCGTLERADPSRFGLKEAEMATIRMSVACYLVVHRSGTVMGDVGAVPDTAWSAPGSPVLQKIVLPDSQQREVTMLKPLGPQLQEIGFFPSQITYLAFSHYHWD